MNFIEKKAILVVSFGTSHENTRAVTIDAIESEIASAFPDFAIYRAWTSGMIIRKILKRDRKRGDGADARRWDHRCHYPANPCY